MRRPGIRFFLTFLAGVGVAALVGASAADVGRLTRPRYEDLILFTQVLKVRALVIGVKTFGKGSVQTVYPLEAGAGLRLTTALYYTPSGRSIQEVGIAPDIVVEAAPASRAAGDPTQSPEAGQVAMPDVQLNRALEVLKSWTYFERLKQGRGAGLLQARARKTAP